MLRGPFRRFTFEGEHDKVGMTSGSIGTTPSRIICGYSTDTGLETDVVLLDGTRSERNIVFDTSSRRRSIVIGV